MTKFILIVASLTIFLSGCVTPSERNRFQLEAANQICSVDALAQEKQSLLSVSNDQRISIAAHQNKYGTFGEETQTILLQKLSSYDAEVEAAYRMTTQSCGAYNRCLERNHHQENMCLRTESMWNQAQQRFSSLSTELKLISADLERERIRAETKRQSNQNRHRRRDGNCRNDSRYCCDQGRDCSDHHQNNCRDRDCRRHYYDCRDRDCRYPEHRHQRRLGECCDTINGIFTDCCR